MLVLVRHAMPAYDESVPPALWPLSPAGAASARALDLPADAYLVSSEETKAWQTLEPFGVVVRDGRFGEVRREGEPWGGDFRELRRTYVDGVDHPDWEPRTEVVARFDAGIRDHLVRASGRPLVVGTHGMAMTVWLTAVTQLATPGTFWASLRFPDIHTVDLAQVMPL